MSSSALRLIGWSRLRAGAKRLPAVLSDGLDLVWPTTVCVELAKVDWSIDEPLDYCPRCGVSAGPGSVMPDGCTFCREDNMLWDRVTRLSAYQEPMEDWIKAMKFGRQWPWAKWLGGHLADRLPQPVEPGKIVIVAVPMHWARRWRRGFNQAELMAKVIGKQHGWPVLPLLRRTRHTQPQPAVAASARHLNVRDSFAMHGVDLTGYQVVLVDDIKTTGATANVCCKLLTKAGARSIHLAVAAVADPGGKDVTRQ